MKWSNIIVQSHSTELKNCILAQIPERKLIEKLCGDDNFVIILGGLHIEMAGRKVIGDWLKDSGWVEDLVHAKLASKVACIPYKTPDSSSSLRMQS